MNAPQITLMGNATRKPELRYSQNDGTPFANISVATNRRRRNQDAETIYFNVTVYRHTAEYAARNVEPGTGIYAQGDFSIRPYTRTDGSSGVSYDVSARDFEIVTRGAPAAALWAQNRPAQTQADTPAPAHDNQRDEDSRPDGQDFPEDDEYVPEFFDEE